MINIQKMIALNHKFTELLKEIKQKCAFLTKSEKTSKTRQNFDFGVEPKITTLLKTSLYIILMLTVCRYVLQY